MLALFAIIRNEMRLLLRDIPGLMILFIMPMLLVLILTALHSSQDQNSKKLHVVIVDADQNTVSSELIKKMQESHDLVLTIEKPKDSYEVEKLKNMYQSEVTKGSQQAMIILPKDLTNASKNYSKWLMHQKKNKPEFPVLLIFLDPTLPSIVHKNFTEQFNSVNYKIQVNLLKDLLENITKNKRFETINPVFSIKTQYFENNFIKPNPVQQYVPAWTIFGMFLIMIPLAGFYIKERGQGILQRLAVSPTPPIYFLFGRVFTFVFINMLQLLLMLSLGVFILPLIGLEALNVTGHILEIILIGFCISMAATGFGVFLGNYSNTFEQAMALGPTLIVVGAAVGGIMAPLYLMPEVLKLLSQYSPLYWAQHSFINLLVRGASLKELWHDLGKLLAFSLVTILLSLFKYMKKI